MRCGGSCEGLRARVDDDERGPLAERAVSLGVERPLSGPYVRQVWGRCVFLDAHGCRLHGAFGPDAKPRVCRTFPALPGGDVDPACFHDGSGTSERPEILGALGDLAHGRETSARLERLPLGAVLDGPALGPTTTGILRALVPVPAPTVPAPAEVGRLAARIDVALTHALVPGDPTDARALLAGGAQLLAGAGVPADRGFPAWTRLLRTGALTGGPG